MEGVSAFIVGTCQIHPKLHGDVLDSMQFSILSPEQIPVHSFQCGSSIEFYIKPINTCIDDIDVIKFTADYLAVTEYIPVLPDDYRGLLDTTDCLQIVPCNDYPGFVELQRLGKLSYHWHSKKFEFQNIKGLLGVYVVPTVNFVKLSDSGKTEMVGPAVKLIGEKNDMVPCLWCPQWLKEATNWSVRRRIYGWPTTANILKIKDSGCHVVHAKHPACRNDIHQWRLSFSVAELYLLQSWTPVQQIVYHMLRFFAKRELIRKDCPKEDEVLCTYHFKTLMLWSCEKMPPVWWHSSSVIEICCYLLRKLSDWLKKRYCPNYFIPHANLFHELMNQRVVIETITRLDAFYHFNILNGWFAVNYIKPVLERVSTFENAKDNVKDLGNLMLRICEIMHAEKFINFDMQLSMGYFLFMLVLQRITKENGFRFCENLNGIFYVMDSSSETVARGSFQSTVEFSSRFPQFVKLLFILPGASALEFKLTTYETEFFTEFIRELSWQPKIVRSKYHNFPKPSETSLEKSYILLLKTQDLMENLTGLNSPQEHKLVSQLSKELLRNALYCDDFMSSDIKGVAFVYMAALHFSESDYKTVIDLCSTVFINQTTGDDEEEKEKETLNAGCLFYIDGVAGIIGLYLLFRRIRYNFMYNRRRYFLDLRLTPEVFAQYLMIFSNEKSHRAFRLKYSFQSPKFPLDDILMTIINRKSSVTSMKTKSVLRVYQRTDPINLSEAHNQSSVACEDNIIQLLIEYSLEHMTSFYNAICKDFDIRCNAVDCYRAAYLYKYSKYPEVLHLCEQILREPEIQRNLERFTFANVMVMPPLDSYFDRDVQCLLGFQTLVYYLSSLNEDLRKLELDAGSTFQHIFARGICPENSFLSLILLWGMKFRYFLGRHFLARYLKVRCLVDCNHSHMEVLFEFKKLKSNLPFEHIIRCLLLKTLRRL